MKALTLLACTLLAAATRLSAQAPAAPEQRLREQLKQVMTQLRTAEAERTNLQTDKAALEAKVKTLEKQSEEITKQMAADKDAAKVEAEKLRAEIAAKEGPLPSRRLRWSAITRGGG